MSSLAIFASPARYVQGRDATAELGTQMNAAGLQSPVLIIADPVVLPIVEPIWAATLPGAGYEHHVVRFGGECTAEEIDGLIAEGRRVAARTVVGCGGGKCLDTARGAADQLGAKVVNCPTAASTDAPCSSLSVVYTADGAFDHYRFYKSHPHLVLLDTSVIARAPVRLLVSGMGDALATYFEARATYEAHSNNMLGGKCTITGLALAKLCYKTLLADGYEACSAVEAKVVTPALERIIEANTLLSGLGFECGGLAVAHAVHNGLTQAPGAHKMLHGEKVAFGTVTQLVLEGRPRAELDAVYTFCCQVGLPVTLEQLGVDAHDKALLMAVAERATQEGETCHSEPFQVTPLGVRDAMLAADRLGSSYMQAARAR